MLKLYIFCAFVAVVGASTVRDLVGTWYSVEFFPSLYDITVNLTECQPHTIGDNSGQTYRCNGKTTESVSYSFSGIFHVSPVIFVKSHAEALQELEKDYLCEGTSEKPTVFQILDNDHYITYVGKRRQEPFTVFRLLFARTIPSVSDLRAYVKTVADLDDTTGDIVCAAFTPTRTTEKDFTIGQTYL